MFPYLPVMHETYHVSLVVPALFTMDMLLSVFYPLVRYLSKQAIPPLHIFVVPPNVLSWLCFILAHPIIILIDVPAHILMIR